MATSPLSASEISGKEASQAEINYSGIGEDLTHATNGLDADLDMCGDLQYADPAVVGFPEPGAPPRDKVSKAAVASRTSPETRPLALVRLRQG